MKKQDLNPAKDQHILQNKEIIEQEITAAELTNEDEVIEIGAGPGNLTRAIAAKAKKVLAFEIDKRFKKDLESLPKNVEVIYANALKQKWKGWNKIIANIPYALSEPIIWKAIEDEIHMLVIIVGDNFKEILCSRERKMGYVAQLFFSIKPILFVKRSEFLPQPRTDSWMIRLTRKEQKTMENIMGEILRSDQRAKNAIMHALVHEGKTKNQARKIIEKIGIAENVLKERARKLPRDALLIIENVIEKELRYLRKWAFPKYARARPRGKEKNL